MSLFTRFLTIECPTELPRGVDGGFPSFTVAFVADGSVPFPQVIVRASGRESLLIGDAIEDCIRAYIVGAAIVPTHIAVGALLVDQTGFTGQGHFHTTDRFPQ